ncbi:hypothetical protein B0H66DRAFT_513334 [Apodospora peruviana]|uniref:AB hydrolase-1 domain-containing protein n=1 Tax=Apodospora peruviana TaxID=516989 RepID=A0AAE0MBR2_9PEZI|nr:hypothetical protein B0H66DRAFT_513334 [Apodospora peruviana]
MASVLIAIVAAVMAVKKGKASPTNGDIRQCVDLEIPVKVAIESQILAQPRVDNNIDAVDWASTMTTWSKPDPSFLGNITIKETFKINGRLCVPTIKGARSDILQLATHGVGFDKRYWDSEIKPKQYSYVEAALAQGYSIFTYDRLGVGLSSKPDAYDIVQTDVQLEILRQLTLLARSGKLISSSKKLGGSRNLDRYTPSNIIHVGHSYGSILSVGLLSTNGSLSDGAILTGFLYTNKLDQANVATWGFEFARESDRKRFGDRGSGYIVQATKSNVQISFFKKGGFEPAMLDYAEEIKQPNTITEFSTLASALGKVAVDFKGPVQFIIGEFDYGFCAGDCKGTYDIEGIKKLYPAAKDVGVHIQPGTGHGLALSLNATAGYKVSFDFLHKSGL